MSNNNKISSKRVAYLTLGQNIYFKRRGSGFNLGFSIKNLLSSNKTYAKDK